LLRLDRDGPGDAVARVTLTRPEVHNAFNASLIAEVRQVFAALAREGPGDLRAVVIAGDGPSFCAGADVAWMRAAMSLDTEANEQDAMAMAEMFETIDTCPAPLIARVHGVALGGRRFDAVRAQRIGLVHEVVEGEAALDAAVESAIGDVLAAGPTAARAAKAIVREVRGLPHGSSKWHTARVVARQRQTEEAQEGFRAFSEKRPPAWTPDKD